MIHIVKLTNKINKIIGPNILESLYSNINKHQPFVITGWNNECNKYKGYYPNPLQCNYVSIITEDIQEKIEDARLEYCIGIILRNGKCIDYLPMIF